jgi:hypothetical protein
LAFVQLAMALSSSHRAAFASLTRLQVNGVLGERLAKTLVLPACALIGGKAETQPHPARGWMPVSRA